MAKNSPRRPADFRGLEVHNACTNDKRRWRGNRSPVAKQGNRQAVYFEVFGYGGLQILEIDNLARRRYGDQRKSAADEEIRSRARQVLRFAEAASAHCQRLERIAFRAVRSYRQSHATVHDGERTFRANPKMSILVISAQDRFVTSRCRPKCLKRSSRYSTSSDHTSA